MPFIQNSKSSRNSHAAVIKRCKYESFLLFVNFLTGDGIEKYESGVE